MDKPTMIDDKIEPGVKLPLRYESAIILGVLATAVLVGLELLSRIFDWTWQ